MTLRRRLLLVYLIVVLLSAATVGIAVEEISHSRAVVSDLKRWQDIVLRLEKLRTAFERDVILKLTQVPDTQAAAIRPPESDFPTLLEQARAYLDFDEVRWEFNKLLDEYHTWRHPEEAGVAAPVSDHTVVRKRLDRISRKLGQRLDGLLVSGQEQDQRTVTMLVIVMGLTVIHIGLVGTLLRLWLLRPLAQLDRQVAALGRDEPPREPLLGSPAELAQLAHALDNARLSLDELRAKILETERMTTIGQLAAQLAHNLRNPLASIRAAAQIARKRGEVDDYTGKRLDEIVAATDRLSGWVGGLIEFVRPQTAQLEASNVVPIVRQVADALTADLSAKDLRLEIEAPTSGAVLMHEPRLLEQALVAVVVNAIEASPVGARIVARVIPASATASAGFGRIDIIDHGPGLPDGPHERIFELSFSTKASGLGIGLTLARQAIQRQGGAITARPNPDGGTIIEFRLPATTGNAGEGQNGSNPDR